MDATPHTVRVGPDHQVATLPPCTSLNASDARQSEEQPEEPALAISALEQQEARSTAALLTAAAFGPIGAFSFIGPCDCGLGLFARVQLQGGQFIGE